ncbi:protein of unknown function [bacterium A37T11]|nr:protein of unknown function [bacterium A37T11]
MLFRSLISIFFLHFALSASSQTIPAHLLMPSKTDSIRQARKLTEKRIQDSISRIQDSLQFLWVKAPDPNRTNLFLDSLRDTLQIKEVKVLKWALNTKNGMVSDVKEQIKPKRERWILLVIGGLLLFFAILKHTFSNEVMAIAEAFFSNRTLGQINKEDNLFTSWAFVFLYILFGFTIGMFMFLAGAYYKPGVGGHRINEYLSYTFFVLLLFTLKIIITRLIGFIFGIQRLVREYVSILYLSYFNAALLFLPLVMVLSLVPQRQMYTCLLLAMALFVIMLVFQLFRATRSILNTYRFSKFYLFIYLCTLEIGPVLVLIKVLGV